MSREPTRRSAPWSEKSSGPRRILALGSYELAERLNLLPRRHQHVVVGVELLQRGEHRSPEEAPLDVLELEDVLHLAAPYAAMAVRSGCSLGWNCYNSKNSVVTTSLVPAFLPPM
eukprot:3921461-Prymnesium_polylepis.2